jgi:hypothetical protein
VLATLTELDRQYADWRDGRANVRTHASGRFPAAERLAEERRALRPFPPARFDWSGARSVRVPLDGYLRHGRCFYRAPERLVHERVSARFSSSSASLAPLRSRFSPARTRSRPGGEADRSRG